MSTNYATTVVVVHDGRNNVEYHIQACEPRSFHLSSPLSKMSTPRFCFPSSVSRKQDERDGLSIRGRNVKFVETELLPSFTNRCTRDTLEPNSSTNALFTLRPHRCRNLDPSRFEGNWIGMYNNNNWIVFPRRIFSSMCREKE